MPAGPIGSVWATGSWPDTAWEANTWADVAGGATPTSLGRTGAGTLEGASVQAYHTAVGGLQDWITYGLTHLWKSDRDYGWYAGACHEQ
jgi:hypothetical protein